MDRPDDDGAGRLLPRRRRHRRGAARPTTPAGSRSSRSTRRTTRCPSAPDGRAVGRAHAARLHVRHQGPRPDDRPADRDEATAEGPARGAPGRPRGEAADLRQGPARRAARRRCGPGSSTALEPLARGGPARARSCSSTRAGSSPARRTATRSRRRPGGCARPGWSGRSSSGARPGSTRRTSSGRCASSATAQIPLVMVDGPQGFKSSVPPIVAAPSPDLAHRPLPRPAERPPGRRQGIADRRAVPLPLRPRRAGRLGAARPRDRRPGEGHARPVQQLLRELRRDERARARAAPARPAGRRARSRVGRGSGPRLAPGGTGRFHDVYFGGQSSGPALAEQRLFDLEVEQPVAVVGRRSTRQRRTGRGSPRSSISRARPRSWISSGAFGSWWLCSAYRPSSRDRPPWASR